MADQWSEKGARIREVLAHAIEANGLTHEKLADETGIDVKQIGRCLRRDGGAHPPLALWAAVLHLDRQAILLGALAEGLGYELRRREPDLAAENRQLKNALQQAIEALQTVNGGGL